MSNLWSTDHVASAARLGSFAIERSAPQFTPWGEMTAAPSNDTEAAPDLEAVRAQAFAEGFDQGRRTVELEFAAEREALAHLAEALEVLRPEPTAALGQLLAETVERLVRQVAGEVEVDGALLARRAEAAAAMIGEETEAARLRAHPEDAVLLENARIPVEIVADPTLERASLVIETRDGWIEDGIAIRIERLRAELDRICAA